MDPALVNLIKYLDAIDRWDLDDALTYFTDDVVYHHPPYGGFFAGHETEDPDKWHRVIGHDALKELWNVRGKQNITHHVTAFARNGNICFNESYATVESGVDYSWVSIFTVDDASLISEYQSYTNRPRRPILGSKTPISLEV